MWITFVFEVILVVIFGFIGILGNCLLILLFSNTERKLNFHKLMIALAVYDTIYILLCMIAFVVPELFTDYKTEGYHFYIAPRCVPMMQVALTGSVYFTVCISLERYLTVCHPFFIAGKNWSAKRYIIPIVLFSLFYNAPHFFEFRTIKYIAPQGNNCTNVSNVREAYHSWNKSLAVEKDALLCLNNSMANLQLQNETYNSGENNSARWIETTNPKKIQYKVELTVLRKNKYYYTIYIIGLNFVFNGLIPFSLIITMNTLLYSQLKIIVNSQSYRSSRFMSAASSHILNQSLVEDNIAGQSNENKRIKYSEVMMSKVTIIIAFVFIIFHSIKWIPNIYELIQRIMNDENDEDIEWPTWVESITQISHFLIVLNSSVNFYIYWLTHYKLPATICFVYQPSQTTDIEMV